MGRVTVFRRKMRAAHPDTSDQAGATTDAMDPKRLNEAMEVIRSHHTDQARPELVKSRVYVGRFTCDLTREVLTNAYWRQARLRLGLPIEFFEMYLDRSQWRRLLAVADLDPGGDRWTPLEIQVVSAGGEVLFSAKDAWDLGYAYDRYLRQEKAGELRMELAKLRQRLDTLPTRKVPHTHVVYDHLKSFERLIHSVQADGIELASCLVKSKEILARIEREIAQLEDGDAVDIAIDEVISGRWNSEVHSTNLRTVVAINAASVRTDRLIDPFTEEDMRAFYRRKLADTRDPLAWFGLDSLRLKLDDYAPADVVDDPAAEAAPLQIQLASNKGMAPYDVTYRYVDGEPTAIVQLSLKAYQRIAPEYGKPHGLPTLPHGIEWFVEVIFDGKLVAVGKPDTDLNVRLGKWQRGRNRAKHADELYTFGSLFYGADFDGVPPWYVGKAKPGRRR